MPRYVYHITEMKADKQVEVRIMDGAVQAARALIMLPIPLNPDLESYSVAESHRGKGLSYALTYLMLLWCQEAGTTAPSVNNAHGILLTALPKIGFPLVGRLRVTKGGRETAGTFQCTTIQASLNACKKKMIACGLIAEGLRNGGPYLWKTM